VRTCKSTCNRVVNSPSSLGLLLTSSPPNMSSPIENWVSNPDEDRGPLMTVVTWSLFGIATCFLAVRYYLRQTQGKLWLDDALLGISWVSDRDFEIEVGN
jgi:hypothetical protein